MSAIYLIRHAQASFGKENYDELSALGYRQSAMLSEAINSTEQIDLVISGAQKRHIQTARTCLEHTEFHNGIVVEQHFNEFDFENIIAQLDQRWHDKTSLNTYLKSQSNPNKELQRLFKAAVKRWTSGAHDAEYKEDWPSFKKRVIGGLMHVKNSAGKSKNIFVFTSAGPISVILQSIMGIADEPTFSLNENLVNTGVTRLLYNDERITVSYINNYSHLQRHGAEFLSFR